jgi:hypothetical protein
VDLWRLRGRRRSAKLSDLCIASDTKNRIEVVLFFRFLFDDALAHADDEPLMFISAALLLITTLTCFLQSQT